MVPMIVGRHSVAPLQIKGAKRRVPKAGPGAGAHLLKGKGGSRGKTV